MTDYLTLALVISAAVFVVGIAGVTSSYGPEVAVAVGFVGLSLGFLME